ncbi:5615_t:CDS:2 [Acaulospora colombiana]|uniref:5615_t:CDS:1 n=1 Tax=Acaulospora colombiana TaxID=27376 RepID=A0ACA9KKA4_9GLOM|nr:5615_t:CDS:2 [Acaulospora colombiana]
MSSYRSKHTGSIKKEEQEVVQFETAEQKTEGGAGEVTPTETDALKQEDSTTGNAEEVKVDETLNAQEMKREQKNDKDTLETKYPGNERENMLGSRLKNVTKLVGAHVSVSGGVHNAIANSLSIGYLINLGNPDKEKREKSYEAFLEDLKRCETLGIHLYNFHPGSSVGKCTIDQSIRHIADCINRAHKETKNVVCVIENMAGSGNVVGSKFEELAKIISLVQDKSRVGVCIDTCHAFAAGYDLRTSKKYDETMTEFSHKIGFQYLRGMHLNDSLTGLGSNRDRHANIGKGYLGLEPFRLIMNDNRLDGIPLILETPVSQDDEYKKEIELLYELVGKSSLTEASIPGDFVEGQDAVAEQKGNKGKRSSKNMSGVDSDKKKKAKSK